MIVHRTITGVRCKNLLLVKQSPTAVGGLRYIKISNTIVFNSNEPPTASHQGGVFNINNGVIMSYKPFAPNEYDVLVGRMLATTRMRLGLAQKDVAEKAGITFQQIQKYETAGNRVSVGRLYQIVTKCFGMTMSEFLGEVNRPYNRDPILTDIIRALDDMNHTGQKLSMQIIACIAMAHPKSISKK